MAADSLKQQLTDLLVTSDEAQFKGCTVGNIKPLTGGISRNTTSFTVSLADGGSRRLIQQSEPPGGSAIGQVDRQQEWDILSYVYRYSQIRVPEPVSFDVNGDYCGTAAMVFEAIDGQSLTRLAKAGSPSELQGYSHLLAGIAANVHNTEYSGLPDSIERPQSWSSYMDAQIGLWAELEKAHPGSDPFMRYVGAWLDANRPPECPLTLVHGDLQTPNVMMTSDGYALLDWELSHIGDPREDLGWYRLVAATTPPDLIAVDEQGFCDRYCELTGLSNEVINPMTIAYFTVLASLRVFSGIQKQAVADGLQATEVMYTTLIQSFIHNVWMQATTGLNQAMEATK